MDEGGQPHNFFNLHFNAKNVHFISPTSPEAEGRMIDDGGKRNQSCAQTKGAVQVEADGAAIFEYEDGSFATPKMDQKGWVNLAEDIDIHAASPLREGTRIFRGRQKHYGGRYLAVIVKVLGKSPKTEDEVHRLLDLDHPNIVRVIRTGEYFGKIPEIFIAMEECLMDLQDYVTQKEGESFRFGKSFSYSKQLTEGVNYIHQKSIVHRDLKPLNVLISKCENFIKISDFGISKTVTNYDNATLVTNIYAGTEGFKAPETYKGVSKYSYKADIFPLGICIYYIFTKGKHPFGLDSISRAYNIMNNKNRELKQIPTFPPPNNDKRRLLQQMIESMLQHKPASRPTAGEVLKHEFFSEVKVEVLTKKVESVDVSSSRPNKESDSETLHHLLELAECELQLKRGSEEDAIQRVKEAVLESGSQTYSDVEKMTGNLKRNGHHIRAMIFLKISYDLSKTKNISRDSRLKMIDNYVIHIGKAILPLIEKGGSSRYIVETYGYRYMKNMLNDLREVKTDNKDLRVQMESSCLINITSIAIDLNMNEDTIEFGKHGVSILESHFGSNAVNYSVYNKILNNMGVAYFTLNQFSNAEKCYLKAINACEKCLDFKNEDERLKSLKHRKANLALTRELLHKN